MLTFDTCLKKAFREPPTNITRVFDVKYNAKVEQTHCKHSSHQADDRNHTFELQEIYVVSLYSLYCCFTVLSLGWSWISVIYQISLYLCHLSKKSGERSEIVAHDSLHGKVSPDTFMSTFKIAMYILN